MLGALRVAVIVEAESLMVVTLTPLYALV